jgi:hypothetical protein
VHCDPTALGAKKAAAPSLERPSCADNNVRRYVKTSVGGGAATPQPESPATADPLQPQWPPGSWSVSSGDAGWSRGGAAACRSAASRLRRPTWSRWRAVARRDRNSASSRRSLAHHGPGKLPAAMTAVQHYHRCFVPGSSVASEVTALSSPRRAAPTSLLDQPHRGSVAGDDTAARGDDPDRGVQVQDVGAELVQPLFGHPDCRP